MGRGLSELQRRILILAGQESDGEYGLSRLHIIRALFDWPETSYWHPKEHYHYRRHFDKRAIGAEKYNAIYASLSRAIRRLIERGLIARTRLNGISLTDTGKAYSLKIHLTG